MQNRAAGIARHHGATDAGGFVGKAQHGAVEIARERKGAALVVADQGDGGQLRIEGGLLHCDGGDVVEGRVEKQQADVKARIVLAAKPIGGVAGAADDVAKAAIGVAQPSGDKDMAGVFGAVGIERDLGRGAMGGGQDDVRGDQGAGAKATGVKVGAVDATNGGPVGELVGGQDGQGFGADEAMGGGQKGREGEAKDGKYVHLVVIL